MSTQTSVAIVDYYLELSRSQLINNSILTYLNDYITNQNPATLAILSAAYYQLVILQGILGFLATQIPNLNLIQNETLVDGNLSNLVNSQIMLSGAYSSDTSQKVIASAQGNALQSNAINTIVGTNTRN